MIDHLGINCADLDAAKRFYDAVLAPLGFSRQLDYEVAVGYGTEGKPDFWIGTFDGVGPNRETHIAFTAPDVERVLAFHAAAIEQGAETLHEPKHWPQYHPGYFAVFVRDPDGNNVEAVCHTSTPQPS